ncbi:MAG: hypothetical protein AAF720_01820 [Pseudomonadota bacterium]
MSDAINLQVSSSYQLGVTGIAGDRDDVFGANTPIPSLTRLSEQLSDDIDIRDSAVSGGLISLANHVLDVTRLALWFVLSLVYVLVLAVVGPVVLAFNAVRHTVLGTRTASHVLQEAADGKLKFHPALFKGGRWKLIRTF